MLSISISAELSPEAVAALDPQWIFVPHWSHLIPVSIWGSWSTVIFQMTDLPYGRGGTSLQNLIQRGHSSTILSALRCSAGLDTGDIYTKQPLSLNGNAEEIFLSTDGVIEQMIRQIVREEPAAIPQQGKPVLFSRRTPAHINLAFCQQWDQSSWQDQIRMLNAEGYTHAFLEVHGMRLEFRRMSQRSDGLHADERIIVFLPPLQRRWLRRSGNNRLPTPRFSKARQAIQLSATLKSCS